MKYFKSNLSSVLSTLAVLGLFASASFSQTPPSSFQGDFSTTVLDPAWSIQQGIGDFSLTENPGNLRYYLTSTTFPGDANALWLYRQFEGNNWSFDTKVSYFLPGGTGRQLYVHILFGGLEQKNVNEVAWWRDLDTAAFPSRNRVVGQFVDGGVSGGFPGSGLGGDPTLGYAVAPYTPDTYFMRILRSDQQVTIQRSADGNTFETIAQRTFTTPLGSLQTVLLSGSSFSSEGGFAEYDYVSVAGNTQNTQYTICTLYDETKVHKSGSTIPIKLQLCDANDTNVSSPSIVVHAVNISKESNATSGALQDSGNANSDNDFRYDAMLGGTGGYIFNVSTKGLTTGTYSLNFTVGSNPVVYTVLFQVK